MRPVRRRSSLGYGDIVMSASWKLLGPLEAANGLLLFGVTTAMIFAVIAAIVSDETQVSAISQSLERDELRCI